MAFNPTYMPANWLYGWYQGFVTALQSEVNKEYGYGSYDDFKEAWGTFNISTSDISPNAYNMMSDLAAYVGNTDVANAALPVTPITIDTDDGPRTVIATGVAVTAGTGEAVRMKIDGFLTSIPWNTVIAEIMLANNYQIQPNMLTELSCKIASQITGQIITNTDGLYVTGKVALDQNNVARSYVDNYVIQGVINGAAAAGDILQNLVGYNVAEDVPIETPELPQDRFSDIAQRAMGMALGSRNQQQQGDDYARLALLTGGLSNLVHNALGSDDGFIMCESQVYTYHSRPCLYLTAIKQTADNVADMFKYTSPLPAIGNFRTVAWSTDDGETWKNNPSAQGGFYSARYVGYFDGQGHAQYESAALALPSNLWSGTGVDYIEISGVNYARGISSNFLATVVAGAEIAQHDIDAWLPTQDGERDIDILWPGWLDGARIGTGAIDVDSNVWFPTRDVPLGIDQTDVQNPGQTIARDYAGVQAGALAGAETGAITITDTIADAITIPSIYNPAIAIPATVAPTPTPTPVIPVLPPSVSAQRLYTVHQVRQDQIDALGAYLWSTDFISLIEHMFTEPIDAVIGLHTLFYGGSLPVGGSETIKLGAISATGCTGQPVQNQYMKFQCGSVNIPEYWNNANDYAPYTKCEIFLPFIGFRDLDINEIMGGSVSLSYGIDIFTGACVAMIGVMRDHVSQALYTFEGNCAVQQPVTGADYSRIVGGLISAGMGIATGGVGAVVGTAAALTSHKVTYNRSGNISANAGACMPKTPYIIIKRPNAYDAPNYRHYYGDPANWTVTLGQCSGYTRVKDVHIDSVACTDAEKAEIVRLLRQGVIF